MRKSIFILMSVLVLTACNNEKKDTVKSNDEQTKTEEPTAVGGEKDEHGCLTSAGESWSQLKQECIQLFEIGLRLDPIEAKEDEAIISAFVIFSDDKSQVELFLPNTQDNTILRHTDEQVYEGGNYKLDTKELVLYVDGIKAYSAQ